MLMFANAGPATSNPGQASRSPALPPNPQGLIRTRQTLPGRDDPAHVGGEGNGVSRRRPD